MRAATKAVGAALLAGVAMLGACRDRSSDDQNAVITDINGADPNDIEAVPEDESAGPSTDDNGDATVTENRSGEERGDGDDMVNVTVDQNRI